MSIEKMSLVTIRGDKESLDETLLQCTSSGCFHPEMASSLSEYASGIVTMREENPYASVLRNLTDIAQSTDMDLNFTNFDQIALESKDFSVFVSKLDTKLKKLRNKKQGIENLTASHTQTLAHLTHLKELGQNFDDIFQCKYLEIRFGKMPVESYEKLHYYKDKPFVIFSYDKDAGYHWCLYICATDDKRLVDGLFQSLYFERIHIPDYAHGTPAQSIAFIEKDLKREEAELEAVNKEISNIISHDKDMINMVYSKSCVLAAAFEMRKYAAFIKDEFILIGFVPVKEETLFTNYIQGLDRNLQLSIKPPESDVRLKIPVKLKNNVILKPFEMFVNIYGLPSYKDIDPTPFVGITYIFLFGLMFGDVGQGLLFSLLGLYLSKKKKMELGDILARIGLSSAFFGFFYGSTFGNETWLMPIHQALFGRTHFIHVMAPSSTNIILIGAVTIGIIIIIASMSMNVVLGIKKKNIERAVLSHNGIAGMVFYVGAIFAALGTMVLGLNLMTPLYIIPVIVLPLLIVFFKEPIAHLLQKKTPFPHGFGGFFVESFFEMFEILLSFVSNTMSFLRVGGFILSHAGMMAVVLTLTEMVGGGASILVMIIGNLFVMGLEGMIVGIQVLRLEYYEIFSRFFDGDGIAFIPATITKE